MGRGQDNSRATNTYLRLDGHVRLNNNISVCNVLHLADRSVQTDFPAAEAPANYLANYSAKPLAAQKFKHPALTKHPARARGSANCQIFGQICWFYANICKIISNILRQQVEKWKISNIFSFLVPQHLLAYLVIWPDVQDFYNIWQSTRGPACG